jgi:hypothetical protein
MQDEIEELGSIFKHASPSYSKISIEEAINIALDDPEDTRGLLRALTYVIDHSEQ